MPALTLREVLALDPVRAARPELLAGEDALDRPVRWVLPLILDFARSGGTPTSEAYEGVSFLDGGELLLTNGFGLTDADDELRRRYVRELAARGAAGLAVEVGRALPGMPPEVTDEARRLGLPLIALHRVVPFVRITEAANRAIVARGLSGRRTVVRPWGDDHAAALLADLADGQALNQPEVEARAALAGFHPGPGARLLGVSLHGSRGVGAVDRAARVLGGAGTLRAAFPGDVLALLAVPAAVPGDPVRAVQEAFRGVTEAGATVAVGHAVGPGGWLHWSETLRAARTTLELALTVPPAEPAVPEGPSVTSARALALERELTRGGIAANRDRLAALVQHTLGPLLAWEAAHPSDLVRTLEVHLRHGCSPTRTAALLHIGRQSLYQRLERIESLLGLEIDDPDLLGELLTAACAHRVVRQRPEGARAPVRSAAAAACARPATTARQSADDMPRHVRRSA
ncbi:PucR family transcriptional regulator [Streptomyces sp. NPDC086777]|uniref:PucR family transcriptional regulator n=1 Tax=Streptomyces sp. NPDC086777 TaxID=3154866 RepID=UPI00344F64AD